MQRLLLSLYPKAWREQYGPEYEALLQDTGMSLGVAFDIVKAGCLLRLRAHQTSLSSLAASFLYALSGVMCIVLGLTDNWPIWAPTTPLRAAALALTLTPLGYALYVRFLMALERRGKWRGNGAVFWLVAMPLGVVSTLLLALMCSFLLLSTGIFGAGGDMSFAGEALCMAGASAGLVKLLNLLQDRLLYRFAL